MKRNKYVEKLDLSYLSLSSLRRYNRLCNEVEVRRMGDRWLVTRLIRLNPKLTNTIACRYEIARSHDPNSSFPPSTLGPLPTFRPSKSHLVLVLVPYQPPLVNLHGLNKRNGITGIQIDPRHADRREKMESGSGGLLLASPRFRSNRLQSLNAGFSTLNLNVACSVEASLEESKGNDPGEEIRLSKISSLDRIVSFVVHRWNE